MPGFAQDDREEKSSNKKGSAQCAAFSSCQLNLNASHDGPAAGRGDHARHPLYHVVHHADRDLGRDIRSAAPSAPVALPHNFHCADHGASPSGRTQCFDYRDECRASHCGDQRNRGGCLCDHCDNRASGYRCFAAPSSHIALTSWPSPSSPTEPNPESCVSLLCPPVISAST